VIIRIVIVAVLALALMITIKDGRVTRDLGLSGKCSAAQTLGDGEQIEACKAGKLAGRPDLSRDGCASTGLVGKIEYWRCPASVKAGPTGN
jgi:hypothetical protein